MDGAGGSQSLEIQRSLCIKEFMYFHNCGGDVGGRADPESLKMPQEFYVLWGGGVG